MNQKVPIQPWDIHEGLQPDRLDTIASVLAQVCGNVLAEHDPDKGDTPWGLGCRAFDRCRSTILRLEKKLEWLKIIDNSKHLVFTIGGVPVRFSKGDEDGTPTGNVLVRGADEIELHQQAFLGFYEDVANKFWRFVIVKNGELEVVRVEFNQVNELGEVFKTWVAPIKADITALVNSAYVKESPADVPDAKFGIQKTDQENAAG